VGEWGDLLVGAAAFVGALTSAFVLVWNTVRSGREPKQVAKSAAEETASAVLDAVEDGELSPEDVDAINRALRRQRGGGS
jgi:hypothetical protein